MPDEIPQKKKHTRLIILEVASDSQDAVDEFAADALEAFKVMPEAIALPPGIELGGFYVVDAETDEEIDYDIEEDEGDEWKESEAKP